jgi:hypothetical protein
MRKYFSTTYLVKSKSNPDGIMYSAFVLAKDYTDAESIIKTRNLNEAIDSILGTDINPKLSMARPSTIFMRLNRARRVVDCHRDIKKLMHLCCFLLHLNERKGLPMPDSFSDIGLMHQLVHALTMSRAEMNVEFFDLIPVLKELESNHPEMFFTAKELQVLNRENTSEIS